MKKNLTFFNSLLFSSSSSSSTTTTTTTTILQKRAPSDFLRSVIGRPVSVRLLSGVDYRGILVCLDGYMNVAMEQTEEFVDGVLRNKYGDTMIRGNNVLYISQLK